MVQIKVTASFVLAATAIAPALAYPTYAESSLAARGFEGDQLEAREPLFEGVKAWFDKHFGHHKHDKHAATAPQAATDASVTDPSATAPSRREVDGQASVHHHTGTGHVGGQHPQHRLHRQGTGLHHEGHVAHHHVASTEAPPTADAPSRREVDGQASVHHHTGTGHVGGQHPQHRLHRQGTGLHHEGHVAHHHVASTEAAPPTADAPSRREVDGQAVHHHTGTGHVGGQHPQHRLHRQGTGLHHEGHVAHHHVASTEAAPPTADAPSRREVDGQASVHHHTGAGHVNGQHPQHRLHRQGTGLHHEGHVAHHHVASTEAAPPTADAPSRREVEELVARYLDDLYERDLEAELLEREYFDMLD